MVLTPVARLMRLVVVPALALPGLTQNVLAQATPKPASETQAVPGTQAPGQQIRIAYVGPRRPEPPI